MRQSAKFEANSNGLNAVGAVGQRGFVPRAGEIDQGYRLATSMAFRLAPC